MNYLRGMFLSGIEIDFLDQKYMPTRQVRVSFDFDEDYGSLAITQDLNENVRLMNETLKLLIKKYEDSFDFFEPQLVIKPCGSMEIILPIKEKDEQRT